jgi:hypothetical protein
MFHSYHVLLWVALEAKLLVSSFYKQEALHRQVLYIENWAPEQRMVENKGFCSQSRLAFDWGRIEFQNDTIGGEARITCELIPKVGNAATQLLRGLNKRR